MLQKRFYGKKRSRRVWVMTPHFVAGQAVLWNGGYISQYAHTMHLTSHAYQATAWEGCYPRLTAVRTVVSTRLLCKRVVIPGSQQWEPSPLPTGSRICTTLPVWERIETVRISNYTYKYHEILNRHIWDTGYKWAHVNTILVINGYEYICTWIQKQ